MADQHSRAGLQMTVVPGRYASHYATLVEEWSNATYWPKHLLVDYTGARHPSASTCIPETCFKSSFQ